MKKDKMVVCFEFENGHFKVVDYDEIRRIAKEYGLDKYEILNEICEGIQAESYTIMSSRLLDIGVKEGLIAKN